MSTTISNKSDVAHKIERWAKHCRDIELIADEQAKDKKIAALLAQLDELQRPYAERIEKLEEKASEIKTEVVAWLGKQKRNVTVESKSAIAQLLTGTRPGNRVPDAQKFIALCKKKKVEPWAAIQVIIKLAEPMVGKNEFDKVCTSEQREYKDATLKLK